MYTSRLSHKSSPSCISPIKSPHYPSLQQQKKLLLDKILNLFTYYSSKISKYSYKQLNEKYFLQLISDMYSVIGKTLIRNSLEYKDYQNIYYSKGRKIGLVFEDFLQTLPVVGLYFSQYSPNNQQQYQQNNNMNNLNNMNNTHNTHNNSHNMDKQDGMKHVLQALISVYDAKVAPLIQAQLVQYDQPINDQTKQIILKLLPSLLTVYKIYFTQQLNGKFNTNEPSNQSFQNLLQFMKDFQVYPKLINASGLFYLYNQTIKSQQNNLLRQTQHMPFKIQQKGIFFKLSKFIQLLISTSRVCFTKLKIMQNPEYDIGYQKQIFKTLLEYMQTIKVTKGQFKNGKYKEHRFSFIVYETYLKQSQVKMYVVKDKIVKQQQNQMEFFAMFDRMKM